MRGTTHKACRRYGMKLCQSDKCPVLKRNYPPGAHGSKRRQKLSEFGQQLREKQIAKIIFGLQERQFRNYYEKAIRQKGDTGQILQQLLEMRLDNTVFRAGFAKTRRQARQMVTHGMFTINGSPVNIPSYQVRLKEEIGIKSNKASSKLFAELDKRLAKHQAPSWLTLNPTNLTVKVSAMPAAQDFERSFSTRLIVEFYSK